MALERFDISTNYYPLDDFEGFTPNEMDGLLRTPFDESKSPLILNRDIDDCLVTQVEFYNHITQYLDMLRERQPLKLTQKGNLPRKFCREISEHDIFEDTIFGAFLKNNPPVKEDDNKYVHIINLFTRLVGFTRKKHGTLSLTNKYEKYLETKSKSEIYQYMFSTYATKFNWAYSDLYPDGWIIQAGFGFSIFLVQKYGDEPREMKFYSDKYLRAFPNAMKVFPGAKVFTDEKAFQDCYYIRVFERFMKRFGLIEIIEDDDFLSGNHTIVKKELIDQAIGWKIS